MTIGYTRSCGTFAEFETPSDISADGINRYALHMRKLGRAARTIQSHLNVIKSFTKWLANTTTAP